MLNLGSTRMLYSYLDERVYLKSFYLCIHTDTYGYVCFLSMCDSHVYINEKLGQNASDCTHLNSGVRRGGVGGSNPPPNRKKMLQKNDVITEVSIFSNKFSQKQIKIQFFYCIFIKDFQNFLKISPTNCVFRPNAQKFNAWFGNFFAKQAKIQHFLQFSSGNFCKFSQNFPKQLCFSSKRENLTRGFVISLQNRRKYSSFCTFLREFFANFRKFSGVRGAPPPDPLRGRTPTLKPPPKFFPAAPL